MTRSKKHHVVIIGGGFGGLYAAHHLKDWPVEITIIDKRNFHLFQPLLYQVAIGGLSPGDIATPLRSIFSAHKNVTVLKGEVIDIDPATQTVHLSDGQVNYGSLIVATGVSHHYFGHDDWAEVAPGLKTVENALDIRRRVLLAFEAAERETNPARRQALMTFVVVGGGPTGVELAGALAELAKKTLRDDFRSIDPASVNVLLLEGSDRVLPPYPPESSAAAQKSLERLGVTVQTNALVTEIRKGVVTLKKGETEETINARTVLWAAGMQASAMGRVLGNRVDAELDHAGRIIVKPDLTVPGQPDIFVIGDLAHFAHQGDKPLPGVAPVAMQQGQYVAALIRDRLAGRTAHLPFHYFDKGSLAVIGRHAAIASVGPLRISGILAWLAWAFIHIWYLIGFGNKMMVMFQWAWNYLTWQRSARLITGQDPFPLVESSPTSTS